MVRATSNCLRLNNGDVVVEDPDICFALDGSTILPSNNCRTASHFSIARRNRNGEDELISVSLLLVLDSDINISANSALDIWINVRSICIEYRYVYEVAVHALMTSCIKSGNVVAAKISDDADIAC